MTTLITGGGSIGLETAKLLRARGERVVVADVRPMTTEAPDSGLVLETCDIVDSAALNHIIASHGITAIIHTAAMLSTAIRANPPRGVLVNTVGTTNILEAARLHRLRRVVIASSTTVAYTTFGTHDASPIEEDFPLRIVSQRPASIYAATKIATEHLALLYADLYGVDVAVLRYAAVLSGGGAVTSVPGRLLDTLLTAAARGEPAAVDDPFLVWAGKEEFVDARDCAFANVCALDATHIPSRVYNIATGAWYSFDEFCAVVRNLRPGLTVDLKVAPTGGFAGFPHLRPAPSCVQAAKRELGFQARFDLAETIGHFAGA